MAHRKILLVDNEPSFSEMITKLLGTHGYKVEHAANCQEALARDNSDTDLILVDVVTPDYNSFKICRVLKTDSYTKHIPLMVLGGRPGENKAEDSCPEADDYLSKPFQPEELVEHIETVLHKDPLLVSDPTANGAPFETVQELRRIVDQGTVVPYFQPIYTLENLKLFGLEVLSRPQTTGKLANPEELFKAALRFGLYYELEMIVWSKAIEEALKNFDHEHLFLNCSPYLIESDKFEAVKEIFYTLGMQARHVFLELTERAGITEQNKFYEHLSSYRQHGFKIAIDDVGAGYSSLESIVQTKPEVVKIDRHIVAGLTSDLFKRSIVKLIVAFCKENGIICIAEGIETKKDLEVLMDLGVQMGQGYYLYKPVEKIDLIAMRAVVPTT